MTVADFYKKFKELMEQGYGEYTVSTDAGLAPLVAEKVHRKCYDTYRISSCPEYVPDKKNRD